MIDPRYQWAAQIDVTNACNRSCSNCTRLVGHANQPFFMDLPTFSKCVTALSRFPIDSPPSEAAPYKVIGILGGEPLLHPQFPELVGILCEHVAKEHRGLWTGLVWQETRHAELIDDSFLRHLIHNNLHDPPSRHSPVLVASRDAIRDPQERRRVIDQCWLQTRWSSSATPRGYYFCEVAASIAEVFGGPEGLPLEDGCWERPLSDFGYQIEFACQRCGIPLNRVGRLDYEEVDDISQSNLEELAADSPRVARGQYHVYEPCECGITDEPWRYKQ